MMNKEELNKKLGYNVEIYKELADIFELEEDYQDYAWNKLKEICRFMYSIDNENTNLKQALNEIRKYIFNKSVIPKFKKKLAIDDGFIFKGNIKDILQIIDKVLGGNEE